MCYCGILIFHVLPPDIMYYICFESSLLHKPPFLISSGMAEPFWMPTATTKSLRLYAYALKPFGLGLPPFSSAVMLCRSLVNQKHYQMQTSSELCSSTSLNEMCSVLRPWFTRRACDHRHSCINLWPRCTLERKAASDCMFPRFALRAEVIIGRQAARRRKTVCRFSAEICIRIFRRPMTSLVLGWEKNSFEIAFWTQAHHTQSRLELTASQLETADVCTDNRPTFPKNKMTLFYSFKSECNRRYVYI